MLDKKYNLRQNGKDYKCMVRFYGAEDDAVIIKLYSSWRYSVSVSKTLGVRAPNVPEGLSESLFCRVTGHGKVITSPANFPKSYDAYNVCSNKRIEVKSTSIESDLTSFSPLNRSDELYFLDMYRLGAWDGTFDIYKLNYNTLKDVQINKNQTFEDQQLQARRPRFSVKEKLITHYGLLPKYKGKLGLSSRRRTIFKSRSEKRIISNFSI